MTQDDAISMARGIAESEGWPWCGPIIATKHRHFIFAGPAHWHIMSNGNYRGQNVNIWIDDATSQLISKSFAPR